MGSFDNKKELRFIVTLGTPVPAAVSSVSLGSKATPAIPAPQITLEGYRAIADINKGGGQLMGQLRAQIFGVSQSDMNSITTLRYSVLSGITNTVQVFAIDGTQNTLIFTGNIVNAWGNYDAMPDVYLSIQARSTYVQSLQPVAPTSFNGPVDVGTAMGQLASTMGLTFENNGVTTQLRDQYLANTALEQVKTLAAAAGCWFCVDNGVLAITPPNSPRLGKPVPIISAETGLKGYPTFDGFGGIDFEAFFNPAVTFLGTIQVVTDIVRAAGTWIVVGCAYRLESEKPNGAWFMRLKANKLGLAVMNG